MELRRVQCTKSGTYFVTLPKTWAKKVGLEKSDVLAISESSEGHAWV
jgi:phosphate uptake regulator